MNVQKLQEVWSVVERQQHEASEARRQHEETLAKLRQEGAARMREAALSRHELLQQVEALTTSNGSSDTVLVIQPVSLVQLIHWSTLSCLTNLPAANTEY